MREAFLSVNFFWEWINGNKKFPYKFLIGSILIALTQSRSIALSYLLLFPNIDLLVNKKQKRLLYYKLDDVIQKSL